MVLASVAQATPSTWPSATWFGLLSCVARNSIGVSALRRERTDFQVFPGEAPLACKAVSVASLCVYDEPHV